MFRELLAILGDTANARFPIHRSDPADGDAENTMATADIRIVPRGIEWDVRESPTGPVRFAMTGTRLRT